MRRTGSWLRVALALFVAIAVPQSEAAPPAGFYDVAEGLEGGALVDVLQALSARGHRPLSYKGVWTLVQKSDEDPNNPDNVLTIYSLRSLPKRCMEGSGTGCSVTWNREHVWAKSHGFPRQDQWAHTDGHHLRAETVACNSARGNLDFALGGKEVEGCLSRRATGASRSWEPPDASKGDVARMMFYMAVRYEGDALNDRTPDLDLVDRLTGDGQSRFGKLCELLRWHHADPVSPEEARRNDVVHQIQGNRNPFIDRPEFAARIWGSTCT